MGHGTDGRKSAARAYRYADTRVQKFQAAELAARLTFAEGHPTLTQLWLRRAVQNAPTPEIEEQLARDYARVRRENPFRFSITGGVKPYSNVNNGGNVGNHKLVVGTGYSEIRIYDVRAGEKPVHFYKLPNVENNDNN